MPFLTANTYIIGHYKPSVRIIDLVSHITYVVCVNFIHKRYSLKSAPNYRFFKKLFMASLFTLRVFVRNRRRTTFRIVLISGLRLEPWDFVQQANTLPTRSLRLVYSNCFYYLFNLCKYYYFYNCLPFNFIYFYSLISFLNVIGLGLFMLYCVLLFLICLTTTKRK